MAAADEQQLVLQVKDGNHGAFRVLVERHMKQAYNVAYNFVNDHDEAEDIAQESFVRIYHAIGTFRNEAGFGTWLYRIVTNLSLNRLRQRKNIRRIDGLEMDGFISNMTTPFDEHHRNDTHALIERALHELPTLQRAVVILRHFNGLSTKQVSSILRCSEGTVKTHLHRGIQKMKVKLNVVKHELV
jgi:RNA polymerase sigma-70 factor, ECF subfamily